MNHKAFFIAIIISILFHLWIINICSDISGRRNYQDEREEIIFATRIKFYTPHSLHQPVEEDGDHYPNNSSQTLDIIPEENEIIEQKESQTENIREEQIYNIENYLSEIKETAKKQVILQRNEIKEEDDKKIIPDRFDIQGEDNNILPENKEEELIPVSKNLGSSEEKALIIENYQQYTNEKDNREIIGLDDPILKEEIETKSVQEVFPLDLTNPNIMDSQITAPKIISFYLPEYPDNLRKRKIEGRVQLRVLIGKDGNVIEVLVDTSSGYQSFDQAAVESVFKWKFKPARIDNEKRDSWALVPVVFELE